MFRAALFAITKIWKQPKYPSTDEWIKKMWYSTQTHKNWTMEDSCSVTKSCPTLCYPVGYSPPGSTVHGIFQTKILEWVAVSFFREPSLPMAQTQVSCISCITGGFFTTEPSRKPNGILLSHKNEIFSSEITWMDLERIMLCEINQTERQILYVLTSGI